MDLSGRGTGLSRVMMDHLTLSDEDHQGRVEWVPLQMPAEDAEPPEECGAERRQEDVPDFMERFREPIPGTNPTTGRPSRGFTYGPEQMMGIKSSPP